MTFVSLIFLVFGSVANAQGLPTSPISIDVAPTLVNCNAAETYWILDGHKKMVEAIKGAQARIETETDPVSRTLIEAGLEKYFKAKIDTTEWETVKQVFGTVADQIGNSVYACSSTKKIFLCSISGAPALTPPDRDRINVCPKGVSGRYAVSGILLHEAMHRFGGKNMDYMSELYCFDWAKKQPGTERLLKTPDAYMLFIHFLGSGGKVLPWTCYAKELKGKLEI